MKNVKETVKKVYGNYPEKILQFGEGNFLRAFVDWMIDEANERGDYKGSIVLCQPIASNPVMKDLINNQEGIYTVAMRGIENGEAVEKTRVITSISRCINAYDDYEELVKIACSEALEVIVSNTTEAGITYKKGDQLSDTPPSSFPAKITSLLYERYKAFNGDMNKGLLFLPVELIDFNGDNLKRIILQYAREWNLETNFIEWIEKANKFTNTLVDRIVTGYPKDQITYFEEKLGYKDNIIVTCELFNLWVIEGEKEWANILPIHKGSANVIWTEDVKPYKMRKVRILNGGHTSTVLAAYLAGHNVVLDFMQDDIFKKYLDKLLYEEVIPTIPLPKEELEAFTKAVGDRFANPYIRHKLLDISLNSCSKFKARCLPSLLEYQEKTGELPTLLTFSLAAFICFYKGTMIDGVYTGTRMDGTTYQIADDKEVLDFFATAWEKDSVEVVKETLSNEGFWGQDLTKINGLLKCVESDVLGIEQLGMKEFVKTLL